MGLPSSELSYTLATTGRGDHDVHKGHAIALDFKKTLSIRNRRYSFIWQLLNISRITFFFLRNTKQYNHLSYIPLTMVPLCNRTLLPAAVKVLETFFEAIL
jgi:hypothetical protein